ncbi:MAG TPA: S8 family serine peptidase [Chitinophagaceae bacterium]|nr:S8 family serine peptidase [Chitinophagaceae bacterium]
MKKFKISLSTLSVCLFVFLTSYQPVLAQEQSEYTENWQLLDPQKDGIYGVSAIRAYHELLKGKSPKKVIVAVIDSGVDTAHVDLKGEIWTNTDEIPGNNIDDDHNGYVDDVHGWNFLGGDDTSVVKASSELHRLYYKYNKRFADISSVDEVGKKDKADYEKWQELKEKRHEDSVENAKKYNKISSGIQRFRMLDKILQAHLGKDSIRLADLKNIDTNNDTLFAAKTIASRVLKQQGPDATLEGFIQEGQDYVDDLKSKLDSRNKNPNAARLKIVGDDPNDITDTDYGNNNVYGDFAMHATHVSGIISAVRNNHIGMNGIANNVLIMPVRTVPNGDERDKDVALAIRYAVDNGADIINMSFGKSYSPHKHWVDEAVEYAAKHDVLLVHAAGNDGTNIDSFPSYPSPIIQKHFLFFDWEKKAKNYITVGASNPTNKEGNLPAPFSNYGKRTVDLFAPGVNIYSTVPEDEYKALSGTSMATPVVVGVAALVLEYYPHLSAEKLKWVLMNSVTELGDLLVNLPGTEEKVRFSSLSRSGGIVNVYKALKLAGTL